MATETQNIYRQVYNAHEDIRLLAAFDRVTCVFLRRSMLAAAFDANGELLTVHYAAYNKERPVWDLDFFEPLFSQEALLSSPEKITKVFFCNAQNMLIPEELYNNSAAEKWLRAIQFVEKSNDVIQHYHLKDEKAYFVYAIPVNIKALVKINCPSVPFIPLEAYQLKSNFSRVVKLTCFVSPDQAVTSLYHYSTLLWTRIFEYATAEDIAYEIRLVCEEHKINADKITVACAALTPSEHPVIQQLGQYFAAVTTASGHEIKNLWSPVLSLIKELETCE